MEGKGFDVWLVRSQELELPKCAKCQHDLSHDRKNVLHSGNLFHQECFDRMERERVAPQLELARQPAEIQIANYNIRPTPVIRLSRPLEPDTVIKCELVEAFTHRVVERGFQAGEGRKAKPGQIEVPFHGLKLSKMNPIKSELDFPSTRTHADFYLRFHVSSASFCSRPFKLVSSISQIPQTERSLVRPPRKSSAKKRPSPSSSSDEEGKIEKKKKLEVEGMIYEPTPMSYEVVTPQPTISPFVIEIQKEKHFESSSSEEVRLNQALFLALRRKNYSLATRISAVLASKA